MGFAVRFEERGLCLSDGLVPDASWLDGDPVRVLRQPDKLLRPSQNAAVEGQLGYGQVVAVVAQCEDGAGVSQRGQPVPDCAEDLVRRVGPLYILGCLAQRQKQPLAVAGLSQRLA